MQTKPSAIIMALALGAVLCASGASADLRYSITDAEACAAGTGLCLTAANANPTWGDDPGEETIILEKPLFITDGGKLTILPGVTVRGNPRGAPSGAVVTGVPGVIVVTRSGEVDWQGENTATGVIVLTTAAVDNNSDLQVDDLDGDGFRDSYPGYDPTLSGTPAGTLPCTCGVGPDALPGTNDDCVGADGVLATGDDDLGDCVLSAQPPIWHDDDPRVAPLAPLTPPIAPDPGLGPDGIDGTSDDTGGESNVQLWGGVAILGNAPTNTGGTSTMAAADAGDDLVEGMAVPGWPESFVTYGGTQPHDSSGIVRFVSVRHAGDEIGLSNELNGFTLGAVGDGTIFEFNEVYANFDDGFEWFGGTMSSSNLAVEYVGDDSLDTDQGYSGTMQFAVSVSPNFNELDCDSVDAMTGLVNCVGSNSDTTGGGYGSVSGDKAGEWDGDDCGGDCNTGSGRDSLSSLVAPVPNGLRAPTPVSAALFYNYTHVGNAELTNKVAFTPEYEPNGACLALDTPYDCCTGATTGTCEAADNSGVNLHNGFGGELRNSVVVNTGTEQGIVAAGGGAAGWTVGDNLCQPQPGIIGPNGDTDNGSLIRSVATLYDDVAEVAGIYPQPNVAYTPGAPAVVGSGVSNSAAAACVGDTSQALENGNAIKGVGITAGGNLVNPTSATVLDLTNEDTTFTPWGDPSTGKLVSTLKASPIDLRPQTSGGYIGGIPPAGHPVKDKAVVYKGALEPGAAGLWTDGWTVLSISGLW